MDYKNSLTLQDKISSALEKHLYIVSQFCFLRCDLGWRGELCDQCIKLPGCSEHGSCHNDIPFTCACDSNEWLGPLCNCPKCSLGKQSTLWGVSKNHLKMFKYKNICNNENNGIFVIYP